MLEIFEKILIPSLEAYVRNLRGLIEIKFSHYSEEKMDDLIKAFDYFFSKTFKQKN